MVHLHIAAGTSYYKAAAPPVVSVDDERLDPAEVAFHHLLYDQGLREFAVSNGLPVPRPVVIRPGVLDDRPAAPGRFERAGGIVVPIGGGKDSMVLIEALKPMNPRLFAVNPHPLVVELAQQAGLELLVVRRQLSPHLDELNRSGALNGHVPITAIISLIAVVGSFVYGYDTIVMAVERSASEETVVVDGVPVNHQYSKSLEFELADTRPDLELHRPRARLRVGPAPLLRVGHRPGLCPDDRLSRHVLQLQHGVPAGGRCRGRLVRSVPEVPVRRPDAGPVRRTGRPDRHHRPRHVRRPRSGPRVRRPHEPRRQALRMRGRAARVGRCPPGPLRVAPVGGQGRGDARWPRRRGPWCRTPTSRPF